jgi:hypothetical protein
MSAVYEPKDALKVSSTVSQIAKRGGKDLDGILASAKLWLNSQVPHSLHVPRPAEYVDIPGTDPFGLEYPVYIDFKENHVRIATGVEITDASRRIITTGLPPELGGNVTRGIQGGVDRGLLLRYLIRGGRIRKKLRDTKRPYGSKLFEPPSGQETTASRNEKERQYPDLKVIRELLEKKVETNSQYTIWNNEIGVDAVSSVDLAWRHLYHSIVHLFLHSRLSTDDLAEFTDKPLASDAELLKETNPLLVARQHVASAQELGQDELGEQSGDFEMFLVPSIVSLAIDIDDSIALDISTRLRELRLAKKSEILDRMLSHGTKGVHFFEHWFQSSDGIYRLLQTMWEIETLKKEKTELKLMIFRLYSNGKSLHDGVVMAG